MKLLAFAMLALLAATSMVVVAPSAGAMPTCQTSIVGAGTLIVATVRSGPECSAYPITVYQCTLKYGEAAPTDFDCQPVANL